MRLRPATRARLLPLLAAALLWLQALGLWHHVVHGGAGPGDRPVASATVHDHHDRHFGDHEDGDAQCRLYDQLAHADLAFGEAGATPVLAPRGMSAAAVPAGRLAPQAAGFLARGPPLTA